MNRKIIFPLMILVSVISIILFICFFHSKSVPTEDVSLVQLIASPDRFHGKMVRVIGASKLEFEGNQVCIHADDIEFRLSKNCLWLSFNGTLDRKNYDGEDVNGYSLIEGVFNMNNAGHMGLFSGAIEKISRYQKWHKRDS